MEVTYIDRVDGADVVRLTSSHGGSHGSAGVADPVLSIHEQALEGRSVLVTGLREDEPVFVLRAQDSLALGVMSLWREMAWQLLDDGRLAQVDADVAAFVDWRRANQQHMKDPD